MKTIFYGSLYDDEFPIYKTKIEEQFKNCAEKCKADGMEVEAWGFDVLVKNSIPKMLAESWVKQCADKYFPEVKNIAEKNI